MTTARAQGDDRPSGPTSASVDAYGLWNMVPDGLLAVEPTGQIVAVNDAANRMFGAAGNELVGRQIETLVNESDRSAHVEARRRWSEAPRPRIMGPERTFPARTLDGRFIEVQVALNPVHIADQPLTIAVIRDVTHTTAELQHQVVARDEIVQRLFGLGMSLRSVIPSLDATDARRIEAVVEGMGDVADALGDAPRSRRRHRSHRRPRPEDGG